MLGVPLGTVKGRMRLGLEKIRGRAGGGTGMNESRHERRRDEHRRLPAGRAGARRGGGAGTPPRRLRGVPHRAEWLRPGGAGAARVGGAGRAAAASCAARLMERGRAPRPRRAGARGRARRRSSRGSGLRPVAGLAALALVVAAVAGYAIGDGGSGGGKTTTVVAGHSPGRDREDGPRGRLRHPAPRQRPPAARPTRSCRPGSSAASRSNRPKTLFVPNRDGTATGDDRRHGRRQRR